MALQKWATLVLGYCLVGWTMAELACKDMDGKDVDWFVALKLPNMSKPEYKAKSQFIFGGEAFYYADSNNQEFRLSERSINDEKSAIGATVSQGIAAYRDFKKKNKRDMFYAFYNDQPPGEPEVEFGSRAHAKGVLTFNNKQGFWLIHSAPRFNDPSLDKYTFGEKQRKFGQSFICGTFLSDQLEEISRQIFVSQFGYYQAFVPKEMGKKYPRLYHSTIMDKTIDKKQCPYFRNSAIKTKGGKWLRSYEKNYEAQSDVYVNQVVDDMKKSFFTETWLNGPRDWKNLCGKIFVKNIRRIIHPRDNIEWSSALDHSKWAVSDKPATVCIGDINRQKSQLNRGGGTLCIENQKIWDFFRKSVGIVECCPGEKDCEAEPDDSEELPDRSRKPGDPPIEKNKPEKKDPEEKKKKLQG